LTGAADYLGLALAQIVLAGAVILLALKQRRLARALREQSQLTREAFESISFVVEQLNANSLGERSALQLENLERLRLLIRSKAAQMKN
jgi:NAD(P)-dependent dehydrogenase (short-subunit alcohol dehydrogenase family)